MATRRQNKIRYLTYQGFLPTEAREYSRTSREGMKAPYFRFMIRSRRRLFDNAKRYGWTLDQYRNYIKQRYRDVGAVKRDVLGRQQIDVWAMLRHYEEMALRRGEEFESPWRKKTKRKSARKKDYKRVTRKQHAQDSITLINQSIARTKNPAKLEVLRAKREFFVEQLKRM